MHLAARGNPILRNIYQYILQYVTSGQEMTTRKTESDSVQKATRCPPTNVLFAVFKDIIVPTAKMSLDTEEPAGKTYLGDLHVIHSSFHCNPTIR